MRFEDELEECQPCSHTHHRPVDGNKERPLDQAIPTGFRATYEVTVGIKEVTKDETKHAHVEDRCWKQFMIHIDRAEQNVDRQHCPQHRIHKQHPSLATYHQLQ